MAVQELAFIFPTIIKIENMNMNFTKHYLGIKMLVVTVIFGTIIILVSCNKEEDTYPEYYTLLVKNNYFEPIDSIAIDNQTEHTSIEVNNIIVCKEQITRTIHELICYTHSNLRLKIQFKAISNKKQIIATIHSDGSISLR